PTPVPEPEPKAKDAKKAEVSRNSAEPPGEASAQLSAADPRVALLQAALMGLQLAPDEEDPATAARLRESIELAKQLINSAVPKIKGEGYMIWGQALARQGKRAEGLKLYTRGMQLVYPGAATKELGRLVDRVPAFQQQPAEQLGVLNSFLAERAY